MLNIWAQFGSKVETVKNQFEQWSGRFVVPELQKKQRHKQKTITFGEKKRKKMVWFWPWAIGLSVAKDL